MHNRRAKITHLIAACLLLCSSTALAQSSELCFDVAVLGLDGAPIGTTEVCADIHENPAAPPWAATILAVHGFTETAATWEPLTEAIFADSSLKYFVKRVIAIDLPGHGDSEPPLGLARLFGDLTINDNIAVLIQSIQYLRDNGLGPRAVIGHSMGGLAIQGAQEALLAQGASLAQLGVYRAVLLAPVPAGGQEWTQPPPSDLDAFVVETPELGSYLSLPPAISQLGGGFTKMDGTLAAGTPSVAELAAYTGDEPIVTTLQLIGAIPELPRPTAREGAFAFWRGTHLTLLSFSEDVLVPAQNLKPLYKYLVGGFGFSYRAVVGPDAVHSTHITDPQLVVDTLKSVPLVF